MKISKTGWVLIILLIIGVLVVIFGNINLDKKKPDMGGASTQVDEQSKKDIYNVLWQREVVDWPNNVPAETMDKLASISPKNFGEEVFNMLQGVKTKIIPLVQRYPERYDTVSQAAQTGYDTRQAYSLGQTMGLDYFHGYAGMKSIEKLEFPRDFGMHEDFQLGWNFFVANLKDEKGNDIDLLVNYFDRAIYPPDIAQKMGLSTTDNQIVEQIVGLGFSDKNLHIQAANPTLSGKTGLVELQSSPYMIKFGNNEIKSEKIDSMFPLTMKIYDPKTDMKIDLLFEPQKPIFLEGDEGKVPSMYNLGTWYYSVPDLKVSGTVSLGDDLREVSGSGWFDNQWTAGVMPTGYPDNYFIRALANILNKIKNQPPQPWAWDWMEAQFDNNYEITLAAMHSSSTEVLKNTGENPPGEVTNSATGKLINPDGTAEKVDGTLTITKWFRSAESKAWYPDGWKIEIPDKNLSFNMTPTSPNQIFHTAAGAEFREGGTVAAGKMGETEINGFGFGEGTGYAGEDYYYKTTFKILGLDDTPANRKLFAQPVPGTWLVIQSMLLFLIPLVIVIWFLIYLFHLIFRRKKH